LKLITKSSIEFKIEKIVLVENDLFTNYFNNNFEDATLVLHGTYDTSYENIILTENFKKQAQFTTDSGYYGAGFYFTTYAEYALRYKRDANLSSRIEQHRTNNTNMQLDFQESFSLMACYIKCGKQYQVSTRIGPTPVKNGFDSHIVYVDRKNESPVTSANIQWQFYDEYVIFSADRILPRYLITMQLKNKFFFMERFKCI